MTQSSSGQSVNDAQRNPFEIQIHNPFIYNNAVYPSAVYMPTHVAFLILWLIL